MFYIIFSVKTLGPGVLDFKLTVIINYHLNNCFNKNDNVPFPYRNICADSSTTY